jgi:hypothetical protein
MVMNNVAESVRRVLQRDFDPVAVERVLEIGRVTGLREEAGVFRLANFERGLLLYQLVRELGPKRVLELGTGRGLGAFSMVAGAVRDGRSVEITTLDTIESGVAQRWPIERSGKREVLQASRSGVWRDEFPEEWRGMVREVCGMTTGILPGDGGAG